MGVIGVPDPVWGEAVKACVVLKEGHEVSKEELIDVCKGSLADFKKPKSIDFFKELPHTAAGKIMYAELRKLYKTK